MLDPESGSLTFWGTIVPLALLVNGLILTAGVTVYWDDRIEAQHSASLEERTQGLAASTERALDGHANLVEGAAGLFEASEQVTLDEFHRYAAARDLPGNASAVNGLVYAQLVDHANLSATLDELSQQHGETVTLTPDDARERYAVVTYTATTPELSIPIGTELHADPARADAMAAALATGEPRLTELLHAGSDRQHVELFMPVFDADEATPSQAAPAGAVDGWILADLDPAAIAETGIPGTLQDTGVHLTVEDHVGQTHQVGGIPADHTEDRGAIPIDHASAVPALGQTWRLETHTLPSQASAAEARQPWILAGVGTGATLLGVGLVLVVSRSESMARRRADEAQAELRKEHAAVELLQAVAVATHDTDDTEDAFAVALEEVCTSTEWEAGHVLEVDHEAGELESTDLWYVEDDTDISPLVEASRGFRLPIGDLIAGHVAEYGDPVFLPDLRSRDRVLHRDEAARRAGVQGAFAFPVDDGEQVVAVLEFFDLEVADPDEDTLEVMESVGHLLGRVVERTRNREAVEQARGRLEAVLESLESAFTALDHDWRYAYLNEAAVDTLPEGMDREDALGRRIWDIYPDLEGTDAEAQLRATMKTRQPHIVEEHDHETGRWWESRMFPFQDGISVLQHEVTERKQREREIERQRRNLEMAEEVAGLGHWTWDLATGEVEWSTGAYEVFGHDPDEVDPSFELFLECVHPEARERVQTKVQEAAERGEGFEDEYRIVHPDGEIRHLHARGQPELEDGETTAMLGTVQDITQRHEREAELREAKEAAEAASRAKSSFLANTSHEIRTPLNAVLGMTRLVLDTDLDAEQQDFARTVRASGEHLLTLINDILDLSKIEAGRMEIEPQAFGLRSVVEAALDIAAQRARGAPIDVGYVMAPEVPEAVETDPGRLRQVLVNLLGNAVKFTEEGEVRLDVSVEEQDGEDFLLRFEVTDTGIGIAEEDQEELFEAFRQVDTGPDRRYQGTGLGLSISKQLTELLGGTISFESEPGVGSAFTFTVEARETDLEIEPPSERDPSALRGLRVLVVDDIETNREILESYLEAWDMEPVLFETPKAALEALEAGEEFDIALLDYMMPDVDGLEFARRLREIHDRDEIPIMLLTSGEVDQDDESAADVGLSATLTKPIKPSTLFDRLLDAWTGHEAAEDEDAARIDHELGERLPLSILVAEDNPVSQKVADAMLDRLGYDPEIVASGEEVLRVLDAVSYDVVFLDVQMPGMDGFETARRIRESDLEHQPRLVAMTAHAADDVRQEALDAGMDDYVPKPVEVEALERALKRAADHAAEDPHAD